MRKKTDDKLVRELTPKMHKFCLGIVEGDGPSEAYRAAYAPRNPMRKKTDDKLVRELTPKMHKFCLGIVEGDGPSEAYRAAYAASSMSDDSVAVEASRLLRDPRVHARIDELRMSLQRVLV